MLLVNAKNGLEVSNEDYSQSRCPILVCPITLARKKSQEEPEPFYRVLGLQRASLMLLALSSPHAQNLSSVSGIQRSLRRLIGQVADCTRQKKNVAARGLR